MGISSNFENIARKILENAGIQQNTDELPELVKQVEKVCMQACEELKEAYRSIKESEPEKL